MQQSRSLYTHQERDGEWQRVSVAPFDRDIELAVINYNGTHAIVFPCRHILRGWMCAETKEILIGFNPTHWRE
jgi:hypothetical protein